MSEFLKIETGKNVPETNDTILHEPGNHPLCIGFLVSDTELGFYQRMTGILKEECERRGIRILIFEGRALNTPDFHARCYNSIYKIISDHRIDALVVASSGLSAYVGADNLGRFLENFPIPTVAIGTPLENISSFSGDDASSVALLLEHLSEHGHRRIVWVSGSILEPHSLERLSAYRKHITGISQQFNEHEDILYGDYSLRSGYEVMAGLHHRLGVSMDALCFANDEMALGAIEYCNSFGIRVPEDLAITGIDDIEMSGIVTPGLTTVSQNVRGMIAAALDHLTSRMEGNAEIITTVFSPELHIRSSCGCETHEQPTRNAFLRAVVNKGPQIGESIQTFDSEELFEHLETFLKDKGVSFCFVMTYVDLPAGMSCHNFEPPVFSKMLHGYMNGRRLFHDGAFQTAQLLPDEMWSLTQNRNLMLKSLFFQNEVFGYIVASAEERDRAFINDLRLMVSVTIKGEKLINEREQAQKRVEWALDAMRTVNSRLSDISLRDELTGLYNRRGFMQEATRHLHGNPAGFLLVFMDMNGLKHINDTLGHDDGDIALRAIGDILRHCFRDKDILARVGGDEFAALVKDVGEEQVERLETRFEEQCAKMSSTPESPYRISFARGYVLGNSAADLDEMMRNADERMYVHKANQKLHAGVKATLA